MILAAYGISVLIMLGAPVVAARLLNRARKPGWWLFGKGAATFVASQVLHIPFNWLVLQRFELIPTDSSTLGGLLLLSIFLGLSSGLFEEVARYITLRYWAQEARSWGTGLMLGIGHGGIESILLGLIVAINVGVLASVREGALVLPISAEEQPLLEQTIAAMFSAPWYLVLMSAGERLLAIAAHAALSLLVLQVFLRNQLRWLFLAIGWHALFNAGAVILVSRGDVYLAEGFLAVMAAVSLIMVWRLRRPEPVEAPPEPLAPPPALDRLQIKTTDDVLDRSRYT